MNLLSQHLNVTAISGRCIDSTLWNYVSLCFFNKITTFISIVFLPFFVAAQTMPMVDGEILVVEVTVNGQEFGTNIIAMDRQGGFYARQQAMEEWNIQKPYPAAVSINGQLFHPISDLYDYEVELDQSTYELAITLKAASFQSQVIQLGRSDVAVEPASDWGMYLDYDISLQHDTLTGDSSGLIIEPVIFTPAGHFYSRMSWKSSVGEEQDNMVFLDNYFRRDNPAKQTTLIVGDSIIAPNSWSRGLRFTGVQYGRNFNLTPRQITFPLPTLAGEAVIPSTVDLFVNQSLINSTDAQPGLFEIPDIPIINGAGELQLIVTDQLGRQSIVTSDFYASSDMLRKGLSAYSINIGRLRENFGQDSFTYGNEIGVFDYQYGLTDQLTIGARLETEEDNTNVGVNGAFNLWQKGILNAALARSSENNANLGRLDYQYNNYKYRLSMGYQYTQDGYQLLGTNSNFAQPRQQFNLNTGIRLNDLGSVGLAYTKQTYSKSEDLSIVSVNYQKSFNRLFNLAASVSQVSNGPLDDVSFGLSFSRAIGDDKAASINYNDNPGSRNVRAQFDKYVPFGEGTGYSVGLTNNSFTGNEVELDMIRRERAYRLQMESRIRESEAGVGINLGGSISRMNDRVNLSRDIQDAFALVKVGEFPNVRVYLENQLIGETDEEGYLMVPGLRPYDLNKLHIEVNDLPIEAKVEEVSKSVTPYQQSGLLVNFEVSIPKNYQFVAMQSGINIVPEGSSVFLENPQVSPNAARLTLTGYNGLVYLNLSTPVNIVYVRTSTGVCAVNLGFVPEFDPQNFREKPPMVMCDPVSQLTR